MQTFCLTLDRIRSEAPSISDDTFSPTRLTPVSEHFKNIFRLIQRVINLDHGPLLLALHLPFKLEGKNREKKRERINILDVHADKKQRGSAIMMGKQSRLVFVVVSLYLLSLGVLTGMLAERVRFDEARSVLLTKLEEDTHRLHEELMAIEREGAVEDRVTP